MSNTFTDADNASDDRDERDDCGATTSHPSVRSAGPAWLIPAIAVLWLGLAAGGMHLLFRHMNEPGGDHAAPSLWPRESKILRSGTKPTLIVFLHPHCACSEASLDELEKIVAHNAGKCEVVAAFTRPPGVAGEWTETSLWRRAAGNSALHAVTDVDGEEALRFGAITSGRTLLYSPEGNLLFDGGVTAGRGTTGENPGGIALNAILAGDETAIRHTPVFGCSLLSCEQPRQLPAATGKPSTSNLE